MINIGKLLVFVHQLVSDRLEEGDIAVDATAGNGHDTLFLAQSVGDKGKVFAFDIQEKAIINTKKRLEDANVLNRVHLIQNGHEKLADYCPENIKAVMFNLGYLPGGEHSIITKAVTTINAVQSALNKLHPNGLITIVVYSGHEGGDIERNTLEDYLSELDINKWRVMTWKQLNGSQTAPYLIVILPQNF